MALQLNGVEIQVLTASAKGLRLSGFELQVVTVEPDDSTETHAAPYFNIHRYTSAPALGDYLVTESGDKLITESGDSFIKE